MNSTSGRKNQNFYTIPSLVRQSQKFNASVIAPAATHYAPALGQRLAGNPGGGHHHATHGVSYKDKPKTIGTGDVVAMSRCLIAAG